MCSAAAIAAGFRLRVTHYHKKNTTNTCCSCSILPSFFTYLLPSTIALHSVLKSNTTKSTRCCAHSFIRVYSNLVFVHHEGFDWRCCVASCGTCLHGNGASSVLLLYFFLFIFLKTPSLLCCCFLFPLLSFLPGCFIYYLHIFTCCVWVYLIGL